MNTIQNENMETTTTTKRTYKKQTIVLKKFLDKDQKSLLTKMCKNHPKKVTKLIKEEEKANKKAEKDKFFNGFTIDDDLVSKAEKNAIILHCLPAYRSKEITNEVFESERNRIFDQAENRLHAQQALLSCLLH